MRIEVFTDGGDAAVHHVGRRDDVGTGLGLRRRDFLQELQRLVVIDIMAFEMAAMAVRRVLAEADVADDHEVRDFLLDGGDGALYRALHVPGRAAVRVLVLGQAENLDSGDAELVKLFRELNGIVDGKMVAVRHARDFFLDVRAGHDEDRIDEVFRGKRGLADHGAHVRSDAHAAGTEFLSVHSGMHLLYGMESESFIRGRVDCSWSRAGEGTKRNPRTIP